MKKSDVRVFKIIVIGDSGVGKTCLTFRYCSGKFPAKTEVTIGVDFREKCVEIEGELVKLQFWDTAGQERFRKSMIQHYYRNVNAVVFVYDVTNPASFDSLPTWIQECEKYSLNSSVPRILIGNKVDCGQQLVATNRAQMFADVHCMPVFETSAIDDSHANHIDSIFMTLAHKLKASKPLMGPMPNEADVPAVVLHRADVQVEHNAEGERVSTCFC